MFTVLIKEKKTGREELLCEVGTVVMQPKPEPDTGTGLIINFRDGCGAHYPISEDVGGYRDVFVMNEAGQTVARYTL